MKSYTDLNQSKKLAEFLPLESADMHYSTWTIVSEDGEFIVSVSQQGETIEELQKEYGNQIIPCWSLAALLEIILKANGKKTFYSDENPLDAAFEMVCWLKENNKI